MLIDRARQALSQWSARPLTRDGARRGEHTPLQTTLPGDRLRLLTFNVQAGIGTSRYADYFTGSWKHVVAHGRSLENIERIARVVRSFDVVVLQEVDGGSLRSGNVNQLRHMAALGGFSFAHQQLNRNLGRLGQFSNGLLSGFAPYRVEDHRLPGLPGRGAIIAHYGHPDEPLVVVGVHLALGEKHRNEQLAYLHRQLRSQKHVVMLGDFNCHLESLRNSPMSELSMDTVAEDLCTYPSWAPDRHIDHILVSPTLKPVRTEVLDHCRLSDHLPLSAEILLPATVIEAASHAPQALPAS